MRLRPFLFLLAFLPALLSATHNRAGQITVRVADCTNPADQLTACATIVTYTETSQAGVDRDSLLLNWGDGSSELIARTRIGAVAPGIQRNEYTLCHRYATFGRYLLSFQDVNRLRNVRNMPTSVTIPFSVSTSFNLVDPDVNGCNSSPQLTQDPVYNTCTGSVWTYNPGAFDVDGDSLAFQFTVPTFARRARVTNYVLPDEVGGSNGDLSIDPRTGQMQWDSPAISGEYSLAFLVKSYRDGLPLDTLASELHIFVDDCANVPPAIELAQEEIRVVAGGVVEFEVVATGDSSEDRVVDLAAGGRPFDLLDNPATFSSALVIEQPESQRRTFRWATTSADISEQEYFVVIRAADDGPPAPAGLATLRTVSIRVTAAPPTELEADYQLFRPGIQYLYENPEFSSRTYGFETQFYGVRVDSLGCADLYGSLATVQEQDKSCVVRVPSPFGYRICQTPDSTVMHFGEDSKLVLYQSAAVGTRWPARHSAGSKLYAEVLSETPATVLGVTDTLKSIGFFTEAGVAAGPTVTIGRHTGLVDGSRFYRVGREALPLSLAGVSEPALGFQLPSADRFGLARVGDTFQIAAHNPAYLPEPLVGSERFAASFSTVVILAVDSSRQDVYTYEVAADLYRSEQGRMVPFALDTVFTFSQSRLPTEMIRQPGARQDGIFSGSNRSDVLKLFRDSCGLVHQRLSTPASFTDSDSCGFDQSGLDATPGPVYVERVPFHLDVINTQAGPQSVVLQYLGSAGLRCGSYLKQSDILLSNDTPPDYTGIPVEVYPNPATDFLSVAVPPAGAPYDLAIHTLSGRRVRLASGVIDRYSLSMGGLPAGAYLLIVSSDGQPVARHLVMVQ